MAFSRLSQEILDKIVDWTAFIQSRDISFQELRKLSLASRSFTPRCRHYIFRRVELATASAEWPVKEARKLQTILCYPHLAENVRVLHFRESAYPPPLHPRYSNSNWERLNRALRCLTRVQEAHIALRRGHAWRDIEPHFQDIIRTILTNRLTNLVINGVEAFPFELLCSLPDLTSLRLSQGASLWIDPSAEKAKVPWTLDSLLCEYSSKSALLKLLPTYFTTFCVHLHTLELNISDSDGHLAAWNLVQAMGALAESRLGILALAYGVSLPTSAGRFQCASGSYQALLSDGRPLPRFPRLHHLDINIDAGFDLVSQPGQSKFVPTCAPGMFCTMLRKAHLPSLSALDLTVSWTADDVWGSVDFDHCKIVDRERGWGEVDDILSNRRLLPRLQHLSVVIGDASVSMAESGQEGVPMWVRVAHCIKSQTIHALRKTVRRGLQEFVVDDPDDEDWLSDEEEDSDFDDDG